MKNFFSAVILAISTSLSISAQDINGVELYDELTHAQVLEMFGEPTKYEEYDDQYEGFSRGYYYGETICISGTMFWKSLQFTNLLILHLRNILKVV